MPFHRLVMLAALVGLPSLVSAQTYDAAAPRRQFVTISLDWMNTQPLHFASHPLEDLVGTEVTAAQFEAHDYQTRDGLTRIDVLEYRRRGRGATATLYPFGVGVGTTLAVRGSVEDLPTIRIAFDGPAAPGDYALTGGRAYDAGIGLVVADRAPGWGLGSRAFVLAGAGRITSDLGDGRRLFAEGGGGLSSGPFGVEIAVKFALNTLTAPVEHQFVTVPVSVRGTVSF